MVILPDSASTLSLKFKTILALSETLVELSAGDDEDKVGSVLSPVVKLKAVVELIPAYELLELSSKAVASIKT